MLTKVKYQVLDKILLENVSEMLKNVVILGLDNKTGG